VSDEKATWEGEVERLVVALSVRLSEVLPAGQFEVAVDQRLAIRLCGVGANRSRTVWLSPMTFWRSRMSAEERLRLFLQAASQRIQKFVSVEGRRWPTATAQPHISITDDEIHIWWGGENEGDATVALRPIVRAEIGI
jgi:hypothetical protein